MPVWFLVSVGLGWLLMGAVYMFLGLLAGGAVYMVVGIVLVLVANHRADTP